MLAARVALQPLQRGAARFSQQQARALHLSPPPRPAAATNFSNRIHILVKWTINRLASTSTFIHPKGSLVAKTFSKLAPRQTIQQSFSFPARVALSRPLGAPFLPRPVHVPRTMTQVGLGTARTFATSQPILQNLVQNVPVAARAFQKAGSDIKVASHQQHRAPKPRKAKAPKQSREMLKPQWERAAAPSAADVPLADVPPADALAQFFAPAPLAAVTTYLDIPLAPTPSGRVPLPERPLAHTPLLPLRLLELGAAHSSHSIKIASLFRRLDAARVWERGAAMEAFGDVEGLCTVLRVRFDGWTEQDVRRAIGEGGKGWCAMQEVRNEHEDSTHSRCTRSYSPLSTPSTVSPAVSAQASPLASPPGSPRPAQISLEVVDTTSFIMPTLDFSSSFLATHENAWNSDNESAHSESDYFADFSRTPSDESDIEEAAWETPNLTSLGSGVSFSSEHWRRVSELAGNF